MAHAQRTAARPHGFRGITACAVGLALAMASGCGVTPKPIGVSRAPATGAVATAFEPTELRIHPLTRLREDPGVPGRSVDLYFELIDRWGHGVKGLGVLTVELRAVSAGGQRDPFQLRTWTVAMSDPAQSSAAFDRVTRTYHLTLADVPSGSSASDLKVRFRTIRGRDLTDSFSLRPQSSQ